MYGETLHTYDRDGGLLDLPPEAQAVVDAHVPPPEFVAPDYGDEPLAAVEGDRLAQAVQQLRTYLGTTSPTQAQTVAAVKLTIRVVLVLARRVIQGPPSI